MSVIVRFFSFSKNGVAEQILSAKKFYAELERMILLREMSSDTEDGGEASATLVSLQQKKLKFVRLFRKEIASNLYQFSPAQRRTVRTLGKYRIVYRLVTTDRLLSGVVAGVLREYFEKDISRHVFSYRPKVSAVMALQKFSKFLAGHRNATKNPKERGLFVLRSDVTKYADSIPVGPRSALWKQLLPITQLPDAPFDIAGLISKLVRPVIKDRFGVLSTNLYGIPSGSPIATVLMNLYLAPVDVIFSGFNGGFYARFGDDVLFAHHSLAVVQSAHQEYLAALKKLELSCKAEKTKVVFLNAAGRRHDQHGEIAGDTSVPFLGARSLFSGGIALKRTEFKMLVRSVQRSCEVAAVLVSELSVDEKAKYLCGVVNMLLSPQSENRHPLIDWILLGISDRKELRQLDHEIVLKVAEKIAGKTGPKAFRSISPKTLKTKYHLLSLCHLKNVLSR